MLDMLPQEVPAVQPLEWKSREPRSNRPSPESLKILRYARKLVSKESRWTQHVAARTVFDIQVRADSFVAIRFCARGAVIRAAYKLGLAPRFAGEAMQLLSGHVRIETLNDEIGHRAVLTRMDDALAAHA